MRYYLSEGDLLREARPFRVAGRGGGNAYEWYLGDGRYIDGHFMQVDRDELEPVRTYPDLEQHKREQDRWLERTRRAVRSFRHPTRILTEYSSLRDRMGESAYFELDEADLPLELLWALCALGGLESVNGRWSKQLHASTLSSRVENGSIDESSINDLPTHLHSVRHSGATTMNLAPIYHERHGETYCEMLREIAASSDDTINEQLRSDENELYCDVFCTAAAWALLWRTDGDEWVVYDHRLERLNEQ